ncbi:MAG: hypothetical protein HY011_26020 [Acidobacteria bacterium]|nr:hypothetical protein [Acidobacteriota bacterium]
MLKRLRIFISALTVFNGAATQERAPRQMEKLGHGVAFNCLASCSSSLRGERVLSKNFWTLLKCEGLCVNAS